MTAAAVDLDGLDWVVHAACRGADPELFFPQAKPGRDGSEVRRASFVAQTYCQPCPVLAACHQLAEEVPGTVGIWGGSWRRLKSAGSTQTVRRPLVSAAPRVAS